MSASSGHLEPNKESNFQGFQDQLLENTSALQDALPTLATAATGQPEQLGHAVQRVANIFGPLCYMASGLASKLSNQQQQLELLDQTRTLVESGVQLLQSSQAVGGNANATAEHAQVHEGVASMQAAVQELTATATGFLSEPASMAAVHQTTINTALDHFDTARLGVDGDEPDIGAFVDFQETSVSDVQQLAQLTQTMLTSGVADPSQLNSLSQVGLVIF